MARLRSWLWGRAKVWSYVLLSDVVIISRENQPVKGHIFQKVVSITCKNARYIEPPFEDIRRVGDTCGCYNCGL
jgi:hypothetical protein